MIDISEMSYEELSELEKQIHNEKRNIRNSERKKVELYDSANIRTIINCMDRRFPSNVYDGTGYPFSENNKIQLSYMACDSVRRIHKSVFTLCDLALKNYIWGKNKSRPIYPRASSTISSELEDEYVSMYNEITEIFLKYVKENK